MLPFYKVVSLTFRVFAKPLIEFTKKTHAKNPKRYRYFEVGFVWLGNNYHEFETRLNRQYLGIDSEEKIYVKKLSNNVAFQKGIEIFYEILLYCVILGIPIFEMYRQANEAKAKSAALEQRLSKIEKNINENHQTINTISESISTQTQKIKNELIDANSLLCQLKDEKHKLHKESSELSLSVNNILQKQHETDKSLNLLLNLSNLLANHSNNSNKL